MLFFSQLSDLSSLLVSTNIDPERLASVTSEAFESRISSVERENQELQRRLQGKIRVWCVIYALDYFSS